MAMGASDSFQTEFPKKTHFWWFLVEATSNT